MIVDRKGCLLILVLLAWMLYLSVMLFSEEEEVEGPFPIEDEDEDEAEDQIPSIDYFADTTPPQVPTPDPVQDQDQDPDSTLPDCIKTDPSNSSGLTNDVSTILKQFKPSGIMY